MITRQSGNGRSPSWGWALAIFYLSLILAVPASAQSGAKQDSIGEDAVDAVTQPLSDLNLRKKDIPFVLIQAQEAPYNLETVTTCDALRSELARLDRVLGPDANEAQKSAGIVNKGLRTGGKVLGGLIPFRGLVRQISGAKAEEARWDAAIYAGVARRSFLKGYQRGKSCQSEEELVTASARDVLGMSSEEGKSEGAEADAIEWIDPDNEAITPAG